MDNTTGWLGELDQYTFHGGCDVKQGTKWIANSWISVGEDRDRDLLNWIELSEYEEEKSNDTFTSDSNIDSPHQEL